MMMKHMVLQTTVENYLKDKVTPVGFDFSGEKKKTSTRRHKGSGEGRKN